MRSRAVVVAMLVLLLLSGCATAAPTPTVSPTASVSPSPSPTPTPPVDPIAGLSLADRVGQLFMVASTTASADPVALAAVADQHIGGVFLHRAGEVALTAVAALVARFTAVVPPGAPPLWVATDQEGGQVQVLSGPGFDRIPPATEQGELPADTLRVDAGSWGAQLLQAGVTVNLAPVADIVTSPDTARANPPIGLLHRQYGYDEQTVGTAAGAFAAGMRQAGVLPTFKHFPGLGRVNANTDFVARVVDPGIGPDSPDVSVYRRLLAGGPALVMVSSAVYAQLDPSSPAVFSHPVVTGLLRGTLGFDGVVITDDVSAARAVRAWAPADRAILALQAGCDIVLVAADPGVFGAMYQAVLAKAQSDPAFAATVDAAARRVVEAKLRGTR